MCSYFSPDSPPLGLTYAEDFYIDRPAQPLDIMNYYLAVPLSKEPLTAFLRQVSMNYLFAITLHFTGCRLMPCTVANVLTLGKVAPLPAMLAHMANDTRCTRYLDHLRLAHLAGAQRILDMVVQQLAGDLASFEPTALSLEQIAPVLRVITFAA